MDSRTLVESPAECRWGARKGDEKKEKKGVPIRWEKEGGGLKWEYTCTGMLGKKEGRGYMRVEKVNERFGVGTCNEVLRTGDGNGGEKEKGSGKKRGEGLLRGYVWAGTDFLSTEKQLGDGGKKDAMAVYLSEFRERVQFAGGGRKDRILCVMIRAGRTKQGPEGWRE